MIDSVYLSICISLKGWSDKRKDIKLSYGRIRWSLRNVLNYNFRERKNTYYSDSEEREESLELEAGAGERRESTLMTEAGSGWQMGSRQFVAGDEIA